MHPSLLPMSCLLLPIVGRKKAHSARSAEGPEPIKSLCLGSGAVLKFSCGEAAITWHLLVGYVLTGVK
jgi:hypothetical protein